MTTPDAGRRHPGDPDDVLYPALSVGAHEFLLTRAGLERMLGDAGFVAEVWVEGATLRALAARSAEPLRSHPSRRDRVDP